MTRLSTRSAGWVAVLFAIFFFSAWPVAPIVHAQDGALEKNPVAVALQSLIVQPDVLVGVPDEETVPASAEHLPEEAQNPGPQTQTNPNISPAPTDQQVTWKNLPIRILGDQKRVWLFPIHVAQGQHLLPTAGVVGVTGGLIAADPPIMFHLRRNADAFDEFREVFSGTNTGIVTALVPATFYVYGLVRKSSYSEQTALLAGEAYVDSAIPHVVMKLVSRRLRPNAVLPASSFSDTFFKSHVSVFGKGSSFPSGHATGIFSIATVVAERYRHRRWVPWVVYGLAASISFSRVPTFAHFPSDVFLGAALGYTITRFDVLRDRSH